MMPTSFEFTDEYTEEVFGGKKPVLLLFRPLNRGLFGFSWAKFGKQAEPDFMQTYFEAAKAHKGKILFAYLDIADGIQKRIGEFLGVTDNDLPSLRAILPAGDMKKYKSDISPKDLTVEQIGKFADDVISGNIDQYLKSEPVPASNNGPVKVLVGKNWNDIVNNTSSHVFVKYYAPWCGHCKKLAPIWDQLGDAFKTYSKDITIAKMDSTVNEVDGVNVSGYPTLIYYGKDDKEGKKYEGERNLEALVKFVEESAGLRPKEEESDKPVDGEKADL